MRRLVHDYYQFLVGSAYSVFGFTFANKFPLTWIPSLLTWLGGCGFCFALSLLCHGAAAAYKNGPPAVKITMKATINAKMIAIIPLTVRLRYTFLTMRPRRLSLLLSVAVVTLSSLLAASF